MLYIVILKMIALSPKRNNPAIYFDKLVTFRSQIWVECTEFIDMIVTFKIYKAVK